MGQVVDNAGRGLRGNDAGRFAFFLSPSQHLLTRNTAAYKLERDSMNKEPTVIINGLSELLRQVLPLLVVVGLVHLSPEKLAGLVSIIGLVLAFVSTTLLRGQTIPTDKANSQIATAVRMPEGTSVAQVIAKNERDSQ